MTKVRMAPVELSEVERDQRAQRLAELVQKKAQVSEAKRTYASLAYRELKEIDAEIRVLSEVVSTGKEIREVEVEEVKDLRNRLLNVIRLDTKEVIDSRQLAFEELQEDLPWERNEGERAVSHVAREPEEDEPREPRESPAKRGRSKSKASAEA